MPAPIDIRRARPGDLAAVESLLTDAQLPLHGMRAAFDVGFVADEGGRIIGAAALECFEEGALLRSVVVDPSVRGRGVGRTLTLAAVEEGRIRKLPAVYLLTTTAERFFPRLGFVATTREDVPRSVQQSVEFQTACPASAMVLHLPLP